MANDICFTAVMCWFFKSRRLKAFVVSGFLIISGLAFHSLDDFRTTTFDYSLSTEVPKPKTRVIDVILLNDELDTLEIRLNELHSVVDVFFIMEAEYTFTGEPKPLYFHDHETRFRQFEDKIVHITIPHLSPEDGAQYAQHGRWANEMFARDKGFKIAIDTRKPAEGDWIVFSDLDEMPRRVFLRLSKLLILILI
ncbi:hypothetical protein BGZ68_008353 [Mortierella alpina]|nr:hypothetical protein BGZ68_008353 [Mortierella alpina]